MKDNSVLSGRRVVNPRALEREFKNPAGTVERTALKLKLKIPSGRARAHNQLTPEEAAAVAADWLSAQ